MSFYNAQLDNKNKKYSIQFETESYESFKEVEKVCQSVIDKDNDRRPKAYWIKRYDYDMETYTYLCSQCKAEYVGMPRSPVCPSCKALIVEEEMCDLMLTDTPGKSCNMKL